MIIDKSEVSNRLLDSICEKDILVRNAMSKEAKANVINILEKGFSYIVESYPELIEDIQRRIVEFHTCDDPAKIRRITDFIHLPQWYSWCLKEQPKDWWSISGKYYNLRMNEVINMYLISESLTGRR